MVTFIIFTICCFLAIKGFLVVQRLLKNIDKKSRQEQETFSGENKTSSDSHLPSQSLWKRQAEAFTYQNEIVEMKTRLRIGLVVWLAVVFLIGFLLDVSLEHFKLLEEGLSFDSFFSAAVLFVLGALCLGILLLRIVLRLVGINVLLFGRK